MQDCGRFAQKKNTVCLSDEKTGGVFKISLKT